jgi:hypothetical protein
MTSSDSTPLVFLIGAVLGIVFCVLACLDRRIAPRRKVAVGIIVFAQLFLGGVRVFGVQAFHNWPAAVWMALMILAFTVGLIGPREKTT